MGLCFKYVTGKKSRSNLYFDEGGNEIYSKLPPIKELWIDCEGIILSGPLQKNGSFAFAPNDIEEMAFEMQTRAAAVRAKRDEKRIASEQKQRQKDEAARERQERRRMMIEEREARGVEQKNLCELQREAKLQQKEAEEAAKKERLLREAEEREKKISENVLYRPGEEPANIRKRIEILFPKLDGAYPNKQISGLNKDHKKWGETVTELYRALGYPDSRAFLEAYGYTVVDNKGGRPSANNYDEIINELKRRYPEGSGFSTVSALKAANSDLPLKTLENAAKQLFGMSLGQYLKSLGILS